MNRIYLKRYLHSTVPRLIEENHYERLKIPFDASISEIKNKFKKISLKLHPDILKSQDLNDEELKKKAEEYLKVKKSYEILSDDKKRSDYDLHLGIKRNDLNNSSNSSFFKRPNNSFHFHEKYRYNDVPHFDSKKHQERNERIEKMYVYNQKMNQNIDRFGRDLYARTLGKDGPRKGIYKQYKYQPDIRNDEGEGKKIAIKLASGVIGIFVLWYLLVGNYSTIKNKDKDETKDTNSIIRTKDAKEEKELSNEPKELVNSVSKSGNKMNVNNAYGMMLIGNNKSDRDEMEILEEQISETSE